VHSLVLALFRHAERAWRCPLTGAKQTSRRKAATSVFDPQRTLAACATNYARRRFLTRAHQKVRRSKPPADRCQRPNCGRGDQLWQDWTRASVTVIEGYGNHVGNWLINRRRARISAMLGLRIHHRRRHSALTCIEMIQLQVLDKLFRLSLLTRQTSRL
jgi:hypothetical protein